MSHDLLEGSFVRTGLVTSLRLVDAYPAQYNSFAARQHRWVRGDWQLFPYLFTKVWTRDHIIIPNPLSILSRWKIFDNLRRSLNAPALLALALLSFSILPGSRLFWLGFFTITLLFPFMIALVEYVLSWHIAGRKIKRYIPVVFGLKAAFLQGSLTFVFLPYQAYLMMEAILVTLWRLLITKRNLLEWVTSSEVEKFQKNSLSSYWAQMKVSIAFAVLIAAMAFFFNPAALPIGMLFFVLWACSPYIAYRISKPYDKKPYHASKDELYELRRIARKTWRYFEELTNARNHFLTPDNFQMDPPRGVAHRTSPTNIGLGAAIRFNGQRLWIHRHRHHGRLDRKNNNYDRDAGKMERPFVQLV